MRRALAGSGSSPNAQVVISSPSTLRTNRWRSILPWLGTVLFAFLLFRLVFGHLYLMRASCECGHTEQWYEFNDRPYTIGVRLSATALAVGNTQHDHNYIEPSRTRRY